MMENQNSIQLGEMKGFTDRLFDTLRRSGVESLSVPQNFYWTVHSSDAFALAEAPAPTMGDIWDDLADLRWELVDTPDEAVTLWHACDHLAGLFKAIASADIDGRLKNSKAGSRK
jgi:hypothetical protein